MLNRLPSRLYFGDEPPFPRPQRLYFAEPQGHGLPKWQWWLRTHLWYCSFPLTGLLDLRVHTLPEFAELLAWPAQEPLLFFGDDQRHARPRH